MKKSDTGFVDALYNIWFAICIFDAFIIVWVFYRDPTLKL